MQNYCPGQELNCPSPLLSICNVFKPIYNSDMPVRFTDSAGNPVLHQKPCNIRFHPKLEILQWSNSTWISVFIKTEKILYNHIVAEGSLMWSENILEVWTQEVPYLTCNVVRHRRDVTGGSRITWLFFRRFAVEKKKPILGCLTVSLPSTYRYN